jgi:hypothetical protein
MTSKEPHANPEFGVFYVGSSKKLPGLRSVVYLDTDPFWQREPTPRCHSFLPAKYCSQGAKTKVRPAGAVVSEASAARDSSQRSTNFHIFSVIKRRLWQHGLPRLSVYICFLLERGYTYRATGI